jgi:hypothetical protein
MEIAEDEERPDFLDCFLLDSNGKNLKDYYGVY